MLESLCLSDFVEVTQVRLTGEGDGFDSSSQQSKIMLATMSAFSEVFMDQLRARVQRGQDVLPVSGTSRDGRFSDVAGKVSRSAKPERGQTFQRNVEHGLLVGSAGLRRSVDRRLQSRSSARCSAKCDSAGVRIL